MKLLTKLRCKAAPAPENAHGQRTIDGSYFTIYRCQNGHGNVGESDSPPERECFKCTTERLGAGLLDPRAPTKWTVCTPEEAAAFLFEIEGPGMYSGVGFKVLV